MRSFQISNRITAKDSHAFDAYLQEISKIDLLTPEQEADLARRIRDGDDEALELLVRSNLRFVVSVAKQYQNNGVYLNDLVNEGNVGLLKAAKRFDETKGFKFISYAVWAIRQTILQAIIEQSRIVRIPFHKVSKYNLVNHTFQEFVQEFEREPTLDELADLLDMTTSEVNSLISSNTKHVSFDSPLNDDVESSNLLDLLVADDNIQPDDRLLKESLSQDLLEEIDNLTSREKEVIIGTFGLKGREEESIDTIADNLALSPERVRQIRDKALSKLRRNYNRNVLKAYLKK
jgi:RNA polymerase primary sigma factor